jgi:hypothetical protein
MVEENKELCPLVDCIKRQDAGCKCWWIVDEIMLITTKKVGYVAGSE